MKARSFHYERAHALAEVSRLQSEADCGAQIFADPDGVSEAGTAGRPTVIMNATNDVAFARRENVCSAVYSRAYPGSPWPRVKALTGALH